MFQKGFLASLSLHLIVLLGATWWAIPETQQLKQTAVEESHEGHGKTIKVTLKLPEQKISEISKLIEKQRIFEKKRVPKRELRKALKKSVAVVSSKNNQEKSKDSRAKSLKRAAQQQLIGEKELEAYVSELRRFIERQKYYPRKAARLKQTGEVQIEIEIDQLGHFVSIDVRKPSRFNSLNKAAIKLVKEISKFKPLPQAMGEKITLSVPLKYQMRK